MNCHLIWVLASRVDAWRERREISVIRKAGLIRFPLYLVSWKKNFAKMQSRWSSPIWKLWKYFCRGMKNEPVYVIVIQSHFNFVLLPINSTFVWQLYSKDWPKEWQTRVKNANEMLSQEAKGVEKFEETIAQEFQEFRHKEVVWRYSLQDKKSAWKECNWKIHLGEAVKIPFVLIDLNSQTEAWVKVDLWGWDAFCSVTQRTIYRQLSQSS